jgi:hypothetical protein
VQVVHGAPRLAVDVDEDRFREDRVEKRDTVGVAGRCVEQPRDPGHPAGLRAHGGGDVRRRVRGLQAITVAAPRGDGGVQDLRRDHDVRRTGERLDEQRATRPRRRHDEDGGVHEP